jgi:hypothetical protein
VNGAAVTALDDEALIGSVRRTLVGLILPRLEETATEEFVISELKSCVSMLDFVTRGLATRLAARAEADRRLAELFQSRPDGSAWQGADPNSTGAFLARAARADTDLSQADRRLAAAVRELLQRRLRLEIESRLVRK